MDDSKKITELLKSVSGSLSAEQAEKAKACKTVDELMNFFADEGIDLPDEMLDAASGGAHLFSTNPASKTSTLGTTPIVLSSDTAKSIGIPLER